MSEIVTDGSATTGDGPALWFIVIDRIQLTMTVVGAVVNTMTVITLQKNGAGFQSCVSYNFELMTQSYSVHVSWAPVSILSRNAVLFEHSSFSVLRFIKIVKLDKYPPVQRSGDMFKCVQLRSRCVGPGAKVSLKQVAFQSNANHPLGESMGYIKFEGM